MTIKQTTYRFHVDTVVDGDTVKGSYRFWWGLTSEKDTLRFLGMNAPELSSGDPYAVAAKEFVAKAIQGKTIRVSVGRKPHTGDMIRGNFNRTLALLYHSRYGSRSLNEMLLEKGLAVYYQLPKWIPASLHVRFKQAEEKAKQKHLGIWAPPHKKLTRTRRWWPFVMCVAVFVCLVLYLV